MWQQFILLQYSQQSNLKLPTGARTNIFASYYNVHLRTIDTTKTRLVYSRFQVSLALKALLYHGLNQTLGKIQYHIYYMHHHSKMFRDAVLSVPALGFLLTAWLSLSRAAWTPSMLCSPSPVFAWLCSRLLWCHPAHNNNTKMYSRWIILSGCCSMVRLYKLVEADPSERHFNTK